MTAASVRQVESLETVNRVQRTEKEAQPIRLLCVFSAELW